MKWKSYPTGAAITEKPGLKVIYDFHAVAEPCHSQVKALCGVKTFSLCMDDSLATDELPDCPRCRAKINKKLPPQQAAIAKLVLAGNDHKQIAKALGITRSTVSVVVLTLRRKLNQRDSSTLGNHNFILALRKALEQPATKETI